jgi:transposase InsO family protein
MVYDDSALHAPDRRRVTAIVTRASLPSLHAYENLGITVGAVLTDNGREFCGKPESHPYELLLAVEGIKRRTTKVRSPRTNGFVERMNRTLLDECFRVQWERASESAAFPSQQSRRKAELFSRTTRVPDELETRR